MSNPEESPTEVAASQERVRGGDRVNDFKLERYKYVLQQLQSLNENIHKYLMVFQTLVTAVAGGIVAVFISWRNLNIEADTARIGIRGLLGLLIILSLYVITSILSGIFSWFDYRREEVKLLDDAVGPGFRQKPTMRNVWRWYETYMVIFILAATIFIYSFVEDKLLPVVK